MNIEIIYTELLKIKHYLAVIENFFNKSQYIDKIFYINLDTRKDRLKNIETLIREYFDSSLSKSVRIPGIIYNGEFVNNNTSNKGAIGCSLSHIEALKQALSENSQNVLILEDDFAFNISKKELDQLLKSFFEKIKEYNLLLLNTYSANYHTTEHVDIFKISHSCCAGAYVVSKEFIPIFLSDTIKATELLKTGDRCKGCIDEMWKKYQGNTIQTKVYTFDNSRKRIGYQLSGYSDIVLKNINKK